MWYNKVVNKKCKFIYETLNEIYKTPKCELNYKNNFELLVAVILSAQCTDKRVNEVTDKLFKIYNTPSDFASIKGETLEKLIYSCGFYKNKAKNIINMSKDLILKFNGQVPSDFNDLISLSGVGRKTANVVLSEGFKQNALAVDTHVFRVSHRLNLSNAKTPDKTEEDLKKQFDENLWSNLHLYMVLFGRYICKSQRPNCEVCKFKEICKYYKEKNKCL